MTGFVEIELDGELYKGEYHVDDGVVTVYGSAQSEFTSTGGSDPAKLAKILLKRLAKLGDLEPFSDAS